MKKILLEGVPLQVKDYFCADSRYPDQYMPKWKQALWLYVNVTDRCNGNCQFCVAGAGPDHRHKVDPHQYFNMLDRVKDSVYGMSFSGGEPTLDLDLLGTLVEGTAERLGLETELDMVTNGGNLKALAKMQWLRKLNSLHISRHSFLEEENRRLLGFPAPTAEDIAEFVGGLTDPGSSHWLGTW